MNTLHARIKSTRLDLGLSQSDLADHTGVSQPTVANWENGSHVPRKDALFRISKTLGVEAIWLLSGENTLAGSPAQQYLNTPVRHVPVYAWPLTLDAFSSQKPKTYYPVPTNKQHIFGLMSDGSLYANNAYLIFDSDIETLEIGDTCLCDTKNGPTLLSLQRVPETDEIIARLKSVVIIF